MNIVDKVKLEVSTLAEKHKALGSDLDDFKEAELIEYDAEQLILDYCESNGYLVNGFPTEKKRLAKDQLEEDYFSRERYQLYLDVLATQKADVAELMWCYVSGFWEDQYSNKEEYIQNLKNNLESDTFYDITI